MGTWREARLSLGRPVVVAHGGNAQRSAMALLVTPRSAARQSRAHGDFRAHQAGGGRDAAQAGDGAQVFFHRQRGGLQRLRVVAGEHQQ